MNENLDFTNFTNNQEGIPVKVESKTPFQDAIDDKRREMAMLATDEISAENGGRPEEEIQEIRNKRAVASAEHADLIKKQNEYYNSGNTGGSHDYSRPGDLR